MRLTPSRRVIRRSQYALMRINAMETAAAKKPDPMVNKESKAKKIPIIQAFENG